MDTIDKKLFFLLKFFLLFLPISIIIGNSAININCLIIIILFCVNIVGIYGSPEKDRY